MIAVALIVIDVETLPSGIPSNSVAMSSIESAPATIPPTSEATFNPAFAPLSVGTLRCSSARSRRQWKTSLSGHESGTEKDPTKIPRL